MSPPKVFDPRTVQPVAVQYKVQRNVLKLFDRSEPEVHLTVSLIWKVTSHFTENTPPAKSVDRSCNAVWRDGRLMAGKGDIG